MSHLKANILFSKNKSVPHNPESLIYALILLQTRLVVIVKRLTQLACSAFSCYYPGRELA